MSSFVPNRRGVPGSDASHVWESDGLAVSLTRLGGRWREVAESKAGSGHRRTMLPSGGGRTGRVDGEDRT